MYAGNLCMLLALVRWKCGYQIYAITSNEFIRAALTVGSTHDQYNLVFFILWRKQKKTTYPVTLTPNPSAIGKTEDG